MNVTQIIVNLAAAVGLPAVVLFYVRDRRKNRAASEVAEGTIFAEITTRDTAALDAHVAFVERAFTTERDSMHRHIDVLTAEIEELRKQVIERDQLIESLRQQVGALSAQMNSLQEQLSRGPKPPSHPRTRKPPP